MVDDETVAQIARATMPRRITRWEMFWRVVACIGAVTAIVGTSVAFSTKFAQSNSAKCINTDLGVRNAPNVADRTALALMLTRQSAALQELYINPRQGITDYQSAIQAYNTTAKADEKARDANPLGKC